LLLLLLLLLLQGQLLLLWLLVVVHVAYVGHRWSHHLLHAQTVLEVLLALGAIVQGELVLLLLLAVEVATAECELLLLQGVLLLLLLLLLLLELLLRRLLAVVIGRDGPSGRQISVGLQMLLLLVGRWLLLLLLLWWLRCKRGTAIVGTHGGMCGNRRSKMKAINVSRSKNQGCFSGCFWWVTRTSSFTPIN